MPSIGQRRSTARRLLRGVATTLLPLTLVAGVTAVTASVYGATGFASIDAIGVTSSVVISGTTTGNVNSGQTVQLSASPREANGRELFRPVTWSSSAPTVATVSGTGLVTGVSVGQATITATADGKSSTQTINVLPPAPVATVSIIPATGGLRKLRFEDVRRGKGRRGGLRIVYFWWSAGEQFWLFTLFDKDEMSDLDGAEKAKLKRRIKAELDARRPG